jgi:DNA repair photolyase
VKVREVACLSAIVPSGLPGLRYALNPYRGCQIACRYCYAPAVLRDPRPWGANVEVKRNIPFVLAKEVKRADPGVVGIGTVTDGYQAIEGRYRITRYCLDVLLRHDWPVSIQTKSSLVLRDVDLLTKFSHRDVGVTITTMDERAVRAIEPYGSPAAKRLETLRKLNEAGIETWAFIGPILPESTEAGLEGLVSGIAEAGTKKILVDRLRLKEGTWGMLEPALRSLGEDLPEAYERALEGPYFRDVERAIVDLAARHGVRAEPAF